MENSENKSLIPTGTSNLAKSEKLLSITQKILSEIKPQYESVKIGNQEWMTRNLDVDRFRNGDLIPHVESDEEWVKAGENGQPAWCYYDNDPDNGKKYGKLYNWFAVSDPRGLAPERYHVPTHVEWNILNKFLGNIGIAGHKMKSASGWNSREDEDGELQNGNGDNSSGFNGFPGGYRNVNVFLRLGGLGVWWSSTEDNGYEAGPLGLSSSSSNVGRYFDDKEYGLSVRCLKD